MIQGTSKTEASYRAVMLDSSSSLKEFSMDRKKYYRKYIAFEYVEDKDSQASVMGKLVETNLMEKELFDSKFYMSACMSAPTGLMLAFVEALYTATRDCTNDQGVVEKTFEQISKEAYVESGFKIKYEAVINKFIGSDAEIFYDEIRKVRSQNLIVVTTQDLNNCTKVVEGLQTNFVTADIINLITSARYTVMNQLQVEAFSIDGHLFKSMMDKVIADHKEGILQVYDLKCVWAVENFYEEYYLYRRAYIQGYVYWQAAHFLAQDETSEFYGYHVPPPKFIVCDSTNYYNPLIYEMTAVDIANAYAGFEYKGRQYPGVKDLILDLSWAIDTNTWNISRKNFLSNGVVNFK